MKRILPLLLALSLFACGHFTHPYAASPAPPGNRPERAAATFEVGVARADITPPATAASFGHAPDAHLMEGYWTRLYCRVFVFVAQTTPPETFAFVPCDLAAPSSLLQRSIAEEVAKSLPNLPASRIFLTATHTHAGPAHYFESIAYGGATSSRFPGFDQNMVDFLAQGISAAIFSAYQTRKAARLRWVHDDVWDLTRNRSIDAYRLNHAPFAPTPPDPAAPAELRAIDPAMDILQIETKDGTSPIGWMVFFAMHPTVLPATNRLFGGDVFGVASRALERELRRTLVASTGRCAPDAPIDACTGECNDPLVALINTNEGDIVPRYEMNTVDEVMRVGGKLADRAISAVRKADAAPFRDQIALDARYVEVEMDEAVKSEGLCKPELGQAGMRGGSEHRATVDGLMVDAPDSDMTTACAPKRKGLGGLQTFIAGSDAFPKHVALAVVRIDTTLLSFVPAELTITAGHMLDAAVKESGPSADRAIIAGLANAYIQYVTTPDEYEQQAYEGASNLYGPRTLAVFEKRLRVLARSLKGEDATSALPGCRAIDEVAKVVYETATQRARFAVGEFTPSLDKLGAKRKHRVLCRLPGRQPVALCNIWEDGGPGRVPMTVAPWMSVVRGDGRAARICGDAYGTERLAATCDPGAALDDRGTAFLTRTRGQNCDGATWMWTSVIAPTASDWSVLASQGPLRVHADGGGANGTQHPALSVDSFPFTAAEPPPECTGEQTRYCLTEAPVECLTDSPVNSR